MKSVILDTDFSSDVGDLGALALACAFHRLDFWRIIAVVCNVSADKAPGAISATLAWWNVPGVDIGTWKGASLDPNGPGSWMTGIYDNYPRNGVGLASTVEDAVETYRRNLASRPDHSIDIISLGLLTNLDALLKSAPDVNSNLSGRDLVALKVRRLWIMGGKFPQISGAEWNLQQAPAASAYVADHWPTDIYWHGFDVGNSFKVGSVLSAKPTNDLMRFGYNASGYLGTGREAWDEMIILAAATEGALFRWVTGSVFVNPSTAVTTWMTHRYGSHHYGDKIFADSVYQGFINEMISLDIVEEPLRSSWGNLSVSKIRFSE